jgi:putative methionine-R-sulfoxide reductase with GAF domain
MQKTIIIIVLCLLGIFVHPFDPGLLDFIYRFVIFVLIVFLVYTFFQTQYEKEVETEEITPPRNAVMEESQPDPLSLNNQVPIVSILANDEGTKSYIRDQFDLLTNLIYPDYGWIFLKIKDELLVLHHKTFCDIAIDDIPERLPLTGLIKILDENNGIVIENNLEETKNLLNYYQQVKYEPRSFLGLTVGLPTDYKLFFVFDSQHVSHFNREDSAIFTNLIKNTGVWLQTRIRAFELMVDLNLHKKLLGFARSLNQSKTISQAMEQFTLTISNEFEATRLTISLIQKDKNQAVIKKVIGQEDEFSENTEFPLDEGLTGWVISKDKPYLIGDMEKGEYFIPRYNKSEKSNYGLRSFLGIPLTAADRTIGAITLEHRAPSQYHETEKTKLNQYASLFSSTFSRTLAH